MIIWNINFRPGIVCLMLKMKTNITRLIGDARDRYILENTVLYHYKSPLVRFKKHTIELCFFLFMVI
jgi:hypothetical protein